MGDATLRNSSRAFTLLEVLIAIALILVLVGAMFGFLFDMLNSRAAALDHVRQQDAANAVVKQLDVDLMTCIVGDAESGSGVKGDQTNLRLLSRGVAASLAAHGANDPDVLGDLQFTEYRFDAAAHRISGGRGAARSPAGESSTELVPLEGTIYKLRFRYHDGNQWQSEFDSLKAGRLPQAVEAALWLSPLPGVPDAVGIEEAPDAREPAKGRPTSFDEQTYASL